jgi:recombination protein RecA
MAGNLKVVESDNQLNSSDRQKALDAALAQIDRAFGKGSAMKLSRPVAWDWISRWESGDYQKAA